MSPSPPSSRKRQFEINQQLQQGSSPTNTRSYEQESSFISSNNNKRSRPLQTQSLTRHEDHQRIRQYPRTLEIFIPTNTNEKETTIKRSYEYERRRSLSENSKQPPRRNDLEIANEYLRCLDDLTDEYENLKRQKKSFDNQKTKTTENYESIEKISRHQPIQIENTYQRSLSESLLYKRLKPIIRSDFTLSEDELFNMEYRLKHKERLKPIRIHSSTNSIPGETSIKYVHTERAPVEVLVPKPQILTRQGEHSSTIVKDTRHLSRKITTNIHQQPRRRTIEGQHELRIIEQPIKSNRTRKVEFTIPKPIEKFPAEHSSTFLVKSKKGGRFHTIDISKSLTHERTIPGEHELRVISQPIRSNLYNKPVELLFPKPKYSSSSSSSSHHSSTIVKQNRTPKSSFIFDNIQTKIKGEHELRFIDKPIESGPGNSVELIVPKNVMDTAEHTTTIITETQPNRRVLEITGSGKKMESEHERKYFHDTVRIEEELEVKLPKQKYEQAEHSATVIKHSRGKGPIIEIDTTQRTIQGEHETKIFEDFIETKADEMQLLIAKPKIPAKHSTTVIKGQRGKLQTYAIDRTQPIPGEYQTKYYDQPIESYSEMEVLFSKQQPQQQPVVGEHMSTLIKNVHSKQLVYGDHQREIPGEHVLTIVEESDRKINKKNENEVEFIVPKPQKKNFIDHYQSSSDYDERFGSSEYEEEEKTSGEHTTTYLKQAQAKYEAIELVVDRPKQLPSISTLIADIQPETQITSIKPTKILLSEDSSVKLDMELNNKNFYEQFNEMEIVLEKPLVRDSSTTLIANIQPGLELKSIQPTQQIRKSIEESSSTFILQREQQTKEEENLLEFQIRKPYIQDSSSTLLAKVQSELGIQGQLKPSPYIPQIIEDSSSALTMNLNTNQQITPFELIIPRIDVESSTSTIIAQIAPTIAGLRTKVDVPQVEKSTSSFLLEQKKRLDQEIELIIPKPKRIETSTSTMLADIEAKLETKDIRSTQIQPETSTSTFLFEEIRQYVIPQPVEIRMKQPIIADSSTTLLANVKATLDTQQIQRLGNLSQPFEHNSSAISFETKTKNIQPSEVELILPRPQIQESTSVLLAEIRPTLDTSQTHMVIPPSLQSPVKSSSQFILETEKLETIPVELHLHRQPSSHTLLANINDTRKKNKDIYVLGTDYQQEQQYGTSTLHADLNKPVELIFNVDEGNAPSISQQYQRNYNTRMLTNTTGGIDNSSTLISELEGRQYQPIEFVVSGSGGGLTGYSNTMDQYSTGTGGYKTTTTTTKRKIASSDTGGFNETTNRSVIRGIRPYDQVDLVLQPDSLTSSSKVLTTSFGLDQGHSPYFSLALHDQTAREGESVLFEVIVSAQPSAEIIWDKNGELIGDESAFRIDYYGNGRATLYIPEAFLDDQGYYTCTATNTLGTCRTTSRLTIDSIGEGISPKRRQLNGSSVYYQQGPTQTIESYRIYSQPTTVTQVTEETQVYQIPGHQKQQQNEITYSIHGTQPKFQPVSFLVSSSQENTQPTTTTITTDEDEQSLVISPYQIFGTKLHTQPNQSSVPSYGDKTSTTTTTTTMYSQQQQQPRNTGLIATVAKQAGPTYSYYQQPLSHESDSMQTESETSTVNFTRSPQQPSTSYITSRPNFTKPLEPIDALEGGTVQITVHLTSFGPQQTRPQIEWYHHAQPIVSDNQHYRITEEYDTSTLEIINVKKEDTGQVWCVANTPAGSATTTCTINIRENPARTYYLTSSQQQVVPQETIYTTQSTHSTHAQIPLHHQQPEQRIPSQYYSTQTITQQQISPQSYTSQTAQDQVSPQSYTSLSTQQPKQQAPFQPYISQEQPQTSSPQSYASFSTQQPKQQAPFQPYILQEQPQTSSPQSFIPQAPPLLPNFNTGPKYSDQQIKILNNGLQNQPLNTGSETIFECQFSGQPDKIQWFRNDVEIVNNLQQLNNRIYHITNLTNGTSRLIIKTTLEEDIGTYSVKLTGPNVEETSNAKLLPASQFQNIQKKKVEQEQRKALVQELEEKQLKRMKPTKTAAPRGSFTYGTSDDEVFLDTTQRSSPYRQPTVPTISRPLKDLDVKEGQPIQLTCQVQGFPKSELFWFKNNVPLPLSARHKMAYDAGGGNITLRINDSRPEDSGLYTVIAKNPQGHVQTSAHVDVQETPGIDETSYVQPDAFKYIEKQPTAPRSNKPRRESDTTNLQQKPAKILKTPMNTSVVEGAPAQFTCQVEGNPKPKIAWLKDNKPLMSGTRFSTYFDQASKTAVLRINDVCKEDQGYYTCIVDNVLNSDRSTATLQVIPESKIDQRSYVETDSFKYLTPENKLRLANKENERRTSGVDSESFVSPDAFRYLEAKKPLKTIDDNLTIDDRPIVDLDAFRYLEARQAPKGKRDDIARASIDDTPIIAPDAFRYLERKADAAKLKKDNDTGPSIDETPQVNLSAFQYLERKEIPKKPEGGPSIDESSIVNPEAFKYLERKPTKKPEDVGPLIDESPMVNPDAFRYLERPIAPKPRDTGPTIDTTPIVNPEVFKYLERPSEMPRIDEGPSIDTRPIVPQEAFRWLDRPTKIDRKPEGPSIDESPYVNPQAFRYIEAKPKPKVIDQGPSIDESSYVNPQAFRYLEAAPSKKPVDKGPTIDTSTYVNPQLFAQFEQKSVSQTTHEDQEVTRAPRVIQPLRSTQTLEGKPIALVAIVDGYPVPQLTWLKDGAELPASNRVTTNYDIPSKTAWIRIDSVRTDDSSVYTLMAHNTAGEVRSDARLNVVPSMTPIDDTAFVPAEAFERIERATAPKRGNIPATTGVDDTAFVNPELFQQFELPLKQPRSENFTDELVIQVPARIIAPLKSIQAPESITVVLDAIVEGSPIPTFTWLKDQIPLSESNRFITNYDLPSKRVTLTIKDVRENDTGTYTLLASNGPQIQHSSATLQIIGAPSIDQSSFIPMDVFRQLEYPQNQQRQIPVQSGVDQTSYISQPDRFAVFDQIQPHRRPLNDFGGVDETSLVSMEKIRLLEIPSNAPKQPYDVEEKLQAPTVLTPLQPIDTQEGNPVVLTAKIEGSPIPNFTWFKDNTPLVASSRFTTYYDIPSKLIVLQINDARPNDTGVYTVRADNKAGDVETSSKLNVSSLPSIRDQSFIPTDKFRLLEQGNQPRFIEEISGVDERPLVDLTKLRQLEIKPNQISEVEDKTEQYKTTILIPLRNVNAIENQPVVLSAQIEGKPQPQFTWFKNDQPLSEGNRFRTHYDIQSKTIFLTIAGAREDDSGTYRLVAKNPIGEEETSCQVTVDINQPNIDQRSFVPQTAFDKLEKPLLKLNNITSGVDRTSFFNQDLFRPFDERHTKHPSAIVGGEDSDAAMPVSAPKILQPLRPIQTSEGDTVLLTTQVEGYPLPQFTWIHNNQPIMASNRITPHYDMLTKRCYLQIFDSRPNDSGTYELLAENPAGQDRTKTELTIVPVSKIDQTGYVPYDKFSTLEFKPRIPSDLRSGVDATPFVSGEIFRLLEAKPINEQIIPEDEQNVPLEVLVPLKPAVAQEGQPVILTTKIRGRPIPQFTWLRNNQPLMESNRFQTHYDFPSETLVLEVSDIWPHDSGTYTVIAEKPKTGERVQTSAPLTVRTDTTSIDRTAFVAPDAFRTLEAAPNLRTVMVESGVDTNSFLTPDVLRTLDQVKPKPTDVQEKEQPLMAPKVIVPLQPINCNEGQPINFTAKIQGNPQPTFIWFKNGQPLQESNRFWSHYDVPSKTVLLQINSARPDDSGTYTLVAQNPLGKDQTQTSVNVSFGPGVDTNAFVSPEKFAAFDQPYGRNVPTQSGVDTTPFVQPERFAQLELKAPIPTKEDMEQMEAPKVITPLQSVQVNEGAPVLLQATVVGKPTPNFVWLKDDAPLAASNRLRTRYDIGSKQVLLQINDVRPQDVGEYLVIATNLAGEDSTVCSLSVLPDKPGVDDRAFVPTDKFRNLERPEGQARRPLEIVPGVDIQSFVSPDKFRNLDHVPPSTRPGEEEIPEEKRPPRVIQPLSNSDLEELMPVLLTTTIDAGAPMATFTWFKNSQPLLEGNRFTTKYDILTKTLTLQILAARPDDQGTYTVRATNPSGTDETTCKLTIRPVASVDTRSFVQPERFVPLELKAPVPKKEDLQQMQPPKFIVPLQSEQVDEGAPVLLQATVVGKPTPNFVWLKDGAPLAASNRLRTRYDIGTKQVLLQINDARPQDIGEYLVIATNPAGEDSTVGSLKVIPDKPGVDDRAFVPTDKFRNLERPEEQARRPLEIIPGVDIQPFISPDKFRNLDHVPPSTKPGEEEIPEEKRPPRVIVPLSDYVLEELMPVILTTTIDAGVPMASFTWLKNGQPLLEGNRFTTKYDILTKTLTLQIIAARPDDHGVYTVRATNPVGSDETTCKLTIQPVSSVDTRPFIQPEQFAPLEVKAPAPKKEDLEQMQPPKVIVPLQSEQVKEGTPVLLQATIIGKPTPNFVWLKDGAPLAASNRLRTRYDIGSKQVLLQINDVRPQDVGEYLVIATNPAGEDSTVCSLSVLPDKPGVDDRAFVPADKFRNLERPEGQARRPLEIAPDKYRKLNQVPPSTKTGEGEVPEEMRPPRVIVPLSDCNLEELMPVLLTATIDAGVPIASFTWLKNNQPLLEGNRFTTKYDIVNRIITLQILASRPDDQGVYTVRATNPVGSDETTCKLTIRPVSSVDTRPFVDAERFRPLDHRPATAGNLDNEGQPLRPPKVLIPMNNIRLSESQPIVLKSIIDAGYPMGNFTWLKDGRPIPESNRYRANFDINTRTASLFIDAARPATDTGRYTVHVENIVGKDQTIGEVLVEGTPGIDDRPFIEPSKFGKFEGPLRVPTTGSRGPILQPDDSLRGRENLTPWIRLLKGLEDQLIDETKAAQLVCVVDAHPPATINWFKDGQPLMISQRFMPDYDHKTGIVHLTVYPVYPADSGQYTMVARNIAGEVSTKCTLRIQATSNVEENPLVKFAGLRKTPQHPSGLGSEPSHKPVDSENGQKPYFIKIPVDQEVPEGQLVRLDYIPAGRPEPSLTWYRNGIPLRPDDADHRDVVNEGGVHSLLIRNPQLGPTVEYTCVAKNKFGEAPFTVHLSVVERGSNIPPYFIEQLYNIIIIEGQDARLDASAQGFPEPKVTWEKEGKPLTPNKEYKVEYEGAKTTLYIRGAKMTDAGWYQCTATSPAGTAITKCKVTVIPLSEAGQYAKDLPQFGPQQLSKLPSLPEEDTRSKYMTVPIKPPDVKPEELYKLPKRPKKMDNIPEDVKRRGVKVLPDEVLAALPNNLEEFPEEEMYSKDRPQPPKFKVHIKSHLNLNEDDHCLFEAKLIPVRDPMMRVQWFKNGKVLHHASRMIPRYDFADVSLEFLWTFAEDDGIYECVATNPYGEDRTRAELKCRPKRSIIYNTQLPEGMEGVSKLQMLEDEIRYTASMIGLEEKVQEKEPKAPEFIMPLEDISVDEGDNAKFIAKVDGHPRPRITWSINDSDIANGSRYKLVFDGLVHYLDIPKTRQYDAGIVRCIAKNSLGQTESVAALNLRFRLDYRSALSKASGSVETGLDDSFDVDIEERLRLRSQLRQRESIDDRARRPSTDKPIHPLHSKAIDRLSWRQTVEKVGDAPNFTKPLLPLKAKEGSKVVVSVEFTGDPPPTVSWYRDGFMVEDSEDFKIHTTSTQSILTIKHAFIIDSGLYTIKLFNPIGIRQCQAAIRIVPIIAEDQTPRFLDVPQDSEILAGDPVRFQCRVEGEPFPTVAFYREDEPVNLNDKRFRVIQENDVFTLLLFEALPADSGQYEAVAENSVGKANTRFTLIVTPRVPGGKKASIIDDPKLIHKVPYLEKPLEDLHVKEGQSATFECIIPASFGSDVKWYKGTSEWQIKPSKFFKPKSDGTKHQLFILEAYAEDEGLYKCVVSNPVGTTATTATLKVDHTTHVPEFIHGFSNLTTYEGEQVRFEVEVRGDPPPTISWFRDGEIIRDSPDFQIFTEGNRSLFYISEVFMEDQGLFTCTASNSAGSSDCSARLIVEPRPQL